MLDMNYLVFEYRVLPTDSDYLGDTEPNHQKCAIIRKFDPIANDPDVSRLLLDVLRNRKEFDLARVEAIKVAGLYIDATNPLATEIRAELQRIADDSEEDEMLRGWADQYINF
jgi:hypothetical protein